jgi:hypothetical protein
MLCDTRLVMMISMALSWPPAKLLLALVLQGRCFHNKNYNTNKVALSFQSRTRVVVLSTCLELVADLLKSTNLNPSNHHLDLKFMCPSFSDGNSGDDLCSCPWEMEEEQNKKGAHEMGKQKENPPPTGPLMGPGTLVPTSVGQVFDFFNNHQVFRLFQKT